MVLPDGPTVSTLLLKESEGAMSTVLPLLILKVLAESRLSEGLELTVKLGYGPETLILELPGTMATV